MNKKVVILLLLISMSIILGCSKDDNPVDNNYIPVEIADLYTGTLTFTKSYALPHSNFPVTLIDSVSLVIDDDAFVLIHNTNPSNLCNSQGEIIINSMTGFIQLITKGTTGTNCDEKRLPTGTFNAVFTDSSIFMDTLRVIDVGLDTEDTLYYEFDLKAVQ